MSDGDLKQDLHRMLSLRQSPQRGEAVFTEENDHNPIILEDCPACRGKGKCSTYKCKGHTITQRLGRCSECEGAGITGKLAHYFENDTPAIKVEVNEEGWLTCPCCSWRFTLKDKNVWTGRRYKRCGQKLLIESYQT